MNPELINLNIFTTNKCNLSCCYCNRNAQEHSPGATNKYKEKSEFKLDDLKLLLNKYKSIRNVLYAGLGEPLLCKDLIPMAEYSKKLLKYNILITNGFLLHKFWGKLAKNFDFISISLHGLDPEELARISNVKQDVYYQLVDNVSWLIEKECNQDKQIDLRASVVFLKDDLDRMTRAAHFCQEHQIPVLDIQNYISNSLLDVEECLYDDDYNYIEFLEKLKMKFKNTLEINLPKPIKRDPATLSRQCSLFFNTLRVDGNGSVTGCTVAMIPKPGNGNFRTEDDVWNNNYFKEMRQYFKEKKIISQCCRYCRNSQ